MQVLYESATGGFVAREYDYAAAEEKQNFDATKVLADLGKEVLLLKRSDVKGQRSADCQIDGEKWEIKTNVTPTCTAIDNAIRSAYPQAPNMILDVKSKIVDAKLILAANKRFQRTKLKRLIIMKGGKIFLDLAKKKR